MKDIFQTEDNIKVQKFNYPNNRSKKNSDKEDEIKTLDNLFKKKFSRDYMDRLTTLLYNSKDKKDYSQKRKNLEKTIFKLDENQKLYLTLPKIKPEQTNKKGFVTKQGNIGTNYIKTETTNYTTTNKRNKYKHENDDYYIKERDEALDENIKEILYEQNNMDKYEEEKGKFLYEKLKTKYENFGINNNKNKKRKNWSNIKKRKILNDYRLIATPQQISEFDYNLGQVFIKGKFRFLTNKQKENLGYIGQLNLFNSMNRIKEKINIIKDLKDDKKNKKNVLLPIDVFKYNAEKWKKYTYEKNRNNNDVIINELNEKNKNKLDDMKEYIDKLNVEAYNTDKEVNKIMNNIDLFLEKYGSGNTDKISGRNSRKSFKSNFKKKEKSEKNLKEEKEEVDEKEEKEEKEELKLEL